MQTVQSIHVHARYGSYAFHTLQNAKQRVKRDSKPKWMSPERRGEVVWMALVCDEKAPCTVFEWKTEELGIL